MVTGALLVWTYGHLNFADFRFVLSDLLVNLGRRGTKPYELYSGFPIAAGRSRELLCVQWHLQTDLRLSGRINHAAIFRACGLEGVGIHWTDCRYLCDGNLRRSKHPESTCLPSVHMLWLTIIEGVRHLNEWFHGQPCQTLGCSEISQPSQFQDSAFVFRAESTNQPVSALGD